MKKKARILVVDDDFDVRTTVAEVLEDEGYETHLAENGQDALNRLRAGLRPDMILLDLMMPVMDGEMFCRALSQETTLPPIAVVIASADRSAVAKAKRCGAAGLLKKPMQLQDLLALAERHTQGAPSAE